MIVDQTVIEQINGRIRRRELRLPVRHDRMPIVARHPKTGRALRSPVTRTADSSTKRCPLRADGVYTLHPRVPVDVYRAAAERQPTHARKVLYWISQCETKSRQVTITVTSVDREGDEWVVRFEKGDWRANSDRPVYLAQQNDFTMVASRQTVKGDPEYLSPLAEDIRRARERALEVRVSPHRAQVQRLRDEADTLAGAMTSMKARNRVRLAAKELEKALAELSSPDGATLQASDRAARQAPVEVEDEPRPSGTESVVPLEPAA